MRRANFILFRYLTVKNINMLKIKINGSQKCQDREKKFKTKGAAGLKISATKGVFAFNSSFA